MDAAFLLLEGLILTLVFIIGVLPLILAIRDQRSRK